MPTEPQGPPARPDLPGSGAAPLPDLPGPSGAAALVPWRWWQAILVYVLGFLVLGFLVAIPFLVAFPDESFEGGAGTGALLASIVGDVAFVIVMLAWVRSVSRRPAADLGVPPSGRRLRSAAVGVAISPLVYVGAVGVGIAVAIALTVVVGREVVTPAQLSSDLSGLGVAAAVVFAIVVAPFTEELFFRGLLFRSLRHRGFWPAAIVSSALFGLVHLVGAPFLEGLLLQIPLTAAGFGFAAIADRWGLTASLGAHVGFNAIGLLLVLVVR
jgi:membrane protease YdiL (CAAX protease family)